MDYFTGNIKDTPSSEVKIGKSENTFIQWLITKDYGTSYALRRFLVKPKGKIQMHYHEYYESLYIIKGKCKVCVGNDVKNLNPGDFIFINSKVKHAIINDGDEDLEFLCVINYTDDMSIIPLDEEC